MQKSSCDHQKLGGELLRFSSSVDGLDSPEDVLNALHDIALENCRLNVLGALMFPLRWGDWSSVAKDKTAFVHKSVPEGWWEEYAELSRRHPGPSLTLAQLSLAPFTMSDIMRMLQPLGIERWPVELSLKYGIRDSLTCPVGGRWGVAFWSKHVLSDQLTPEIRAMLFMGATFAAIRLEKLCEPYANRIGDSGGTLTPRELAVLRLASAGHQIRDTAALLGLGEETVRSHLKKAQARLGVNNRAHAVAQAIRRQLIP
jgi:DNA-binding CsgD family transcriptional regulator